MLYYKIEGEGEPVLLIHGYLENHKMWKDISAVLSKNHKVIMPDLPGHGRSPNYGEVHTMELAAQKIIEVLDELKIGRVIVIGHSMGGYITLALAGLFAERVKSFLLLNSSSLPDTEEKKLLRARAMELAENNRETLIKMSIPLLFAEQNADSFMAEKEFTREMMRETSVHGIKAALRGMMERPDRTAVLAKFDGNIGIVLGRNDRTVDPNVFRAVIPDRENITVLELDCGHMSYFENKQETIEFISEFVGKTDNSEV